jgi:hypothetical protein
MQLKAPRPWTVLAHGPVEALEPNLRVVEGHLPRWHIPRRMCVVRLESGDLVFFNALPLREAEMASLQAWGRPAVLVIPNGLHRLDVHAFKVRYPALRVLCPKGVHDRVAQVVRVDGGVEDFPTDAAVQLLPIRGTKERECCLAVRSGARTSLCFGDLVMNLHRVSGLDGFLFKLLGSVGGPRVTPLTRLLVVQDSRQLRGQLEELAALPALAHLIPTHGELVSEGAGRVLRAVAAGLPD